MKGARGDGVFETALQTRAAEWRFMVCERSVCGSKYKMSVVSRAQSDQAQSDQGGRCYQERRSSILPRVTLLS